MAPSDDQPRATGNSFLDTLPVETRIRLNQHLALQTLHKGQVLAEPGKPANTVYFPVHSMISTVTQTLEGSAVEVGLTGHEGLGPITIAFDSRVSRHLTVVQVPDSGYAIRADTFLAELAANAELRRRALRYAEYCFAAATQFTACNGLHSLEERYARWILMTDDRVGLDEFNLTQEYSAQMLGIRRASVTNVARALSSEGLISYKRGVMSVTDRDGLVEAACECYGAVNDDLQRLMGYGARHALAGDPA